MNTEYEPDQGAIEAWKSSRSGAWAGRGFHYQHLISTYILLRQWAGLSPAGFIVPEGMDDCVVELADRDIWIQIKSRKGSAFNSSEVQSFLTAALAKTATVEGKKKSRATVVLENPRAGRNEADIDQIFGCNSLSVFVCAEPGEEAVKLISRQCGTAEIIAEGIVSDLYRLVADASQANASLSFEQRRRISTTEVERRIFRRLEAEDPSKIDHVMVSGALEPVDFNSSINEPAFYQGVKVRPGHVSAGLVLDRPEDTESVVSTLRRRRHVLISGPSGSGKSALMWLVAHALTGELRWYQISARAVVADVNAIISFLRARQPSEESPIGLAFDDIGSTNSDLWDVLVRELRGMPSVYSLGSVRQEDATLIANSSDTEFINVSLDEKLAERVWQMLHAENQTRWEHWREPFEQSEGLMLEYVHLLTQGRRLAAVIDEQVRQRQHEERHDELAIIRITAVLCARGAEVQARKLFEFINMKPEDASRALSRLIDEHLVKECRPGVLGGLHMLRSHALSKASHDEIANLSEDSLWLGIPAVTGETLPRTVQSIFNDTQEGDEDAVLGKLAEILGDSSDLETWIAILTGLGLATLERRVSLFMEVLEQHGVQRAQWLLASMFGDPDIEIPALSEFEQWQIVRDAVLSYRALPIDDLRHACLEYLPTESVLPSCRSLQQANMFLSCLAPICGGEPVRLAVAPDCISHGEQDIRQVAALLSTAYLIGRDVAENLAQEFGGEQVLLGWFRSQTPWVTMPEVDSNGAHGRTVRSNWYFVAEQEQPDPHETVCRICETLIALSPNSEAAASDAVNPQGQPIAVGGHTPWSKNMPRNDIPSKARIAWNVAFRQIMLARANSDNLTDYSRQMAELARRTETAFRSFTEKWIGGKSVGNADAMAEEVNQIVQAVNALAYATPEPPAPEMTVPASGAGEDDTFGAMLTGVLANLMRRMGKIPEEGTKGAAIFAGSLAAQARLHEQSPIWRTCSEPPLRELGALGERLGDVADILHEMAHDDGKSAIDGIVKAARKGQLGKRVRAAARRCNSLAYRRFHQKLKTLENALSSNGWDVRCCSRPIDEEDSVHWPAREVAILVKITDFEADGGYIDDSFTVGQDQLGADWRFSVVPVINGYVVPALAMLPSSHIPLPYYDFEKDWKDHIDRPFLSPEIVSAFDEALAACTRVSGILACRELDNLHSDENEVLSRSLECFKRNHDCVAEAAESTDSEYLAWAYNYLKDTWDEVVREFEAAKAGQPVAEPIYMNAYLALSGQQNDQISELAALRILILQSECASAAAGDRSQPPKVQ